MPPGYQHPTHGIAGAWTWSSPCGSCTPNRPLIGSSVLANSCGRWNACTRRSSRHIRSCRHSTWSCDSLRKCSARPARTSRRHFHRFRTCRVGAWPRRPPFADKSGSMARSYSATLAARRCPTRRAADRRSCRSWAATYSSGQSQDMGSRSFYSPFQPMPMIRWSGSSLPKLTSRVTSGSFSKTTW